MSPMTRTALTAIVIGSLVSSVGHCSDWWVAPDGRDNKGGGSRNRPWASLQFAAGQVGAGDTVHVQDGNYVGFYLSRGGDANALIRFMAEGNAVHITGRNLKTPDGINIEGANYIVVDGFAVSEMPRAGIRVTHSRNSVIRRNRCDHNGSWGIFISFCDDILIEANTGSNSVKEHGIYVSNSGDRPTIRKNLVFGNRSAGIHLNGDLSQGGDGLISEALIEANIIHHNGAGGASGINCDGVQKSVIRNNLLYKNLSSGISLFKIDGAAGSINNYVINNTIVQPPKARWAINIKNQSINNHVANNILIHTGSRGSINVSSDSMPGLKSDHNIVTDRFSTDDGEQIINLSTWNAITLLDGHSRTSKPSSLFVDESAADYHLCKGSRAIDAADPSLAPRVDLDGIIRPVGPRPDAGAYEARGNGE